MWPKTAEAKMGRTIDAIDRDIGEAIKVIARKGKMRPLLAFSAGIDLLNEKIGNLCNFLVLAACVVSAGNAMIRNAFGYSSNGWLELQWYMFAVFVMFGASYTFKRNEHVRVEIFYLMLSERGQRRGLEPVFGRPPGGQRKARWCSADEIFPFNINKLPIDECIARWFGALASCEFGRISRGARTGAVKTAEAAGGEDHRCNRS